MSDERDVPIETERTALAPLEAEPAPKPLVVIQYRNRGLPRALFPPLLVLVAALSIVSYRRQQPLRPLVLAAAEGSAAPVAAGRGRLILVEPSGIPMAPEPVVVRSEPPPAPAATAADPKGGPTPTQAAAAKAPDAPPSQEAGTVVVSTPGSREQGQPPAQPAAAVPPPLAPAPREAVQAQRDEGPAPGRPAIGFQPPGDRPLAQPQPEAAKDRKPELTKDQILSDIRHEAQQKEAELQDLDEVKPRLQAQELAELRRQAQENRVLFHNELRRVLKLPAGAAGRQIDGLCEQYGRSAPPEVHALVTKLLKRSAAHYSRQAKIDLMRSYGLPEPMVLDFLANELHRLVNSRNGPRDEEEVRALAARLLVSSYPVRRPRKANPPAPPAKAAARPFATIEALPGTAPGRRAP